VKVITSIAKMQEFSRQVHIAGLTVGFVPTMGYLHEGHLELVRRARREADVVVVSIFVNPKQFDRDDDFEQYPRDDRHDRGLLEGEHVEVLFMPNAEDVYTRDAATNVAVERLTDELCGPHRPGHFDGVTTVVAALFNMVLPDFAVFGEKDYQQLQVIRRMVHDLHFPVRIVAAPIVREADGLAMSSRNARLSSAARDTAALISSGLAAVASAFVGGERRADVLLAIARDTLATAPDIEIEYLDLVDGKTLGPVQWADERSVIAIAAWIGDVRLIDNIVLARWLSEHDSGSLDGADVADDPAASATSGPDGTSDTAGRRTAETETLPHTIHRRAYYDA
jgi:pantoate--beta-alanine ligase